MILDMAVLSDKFELFFARPVALSSFARNSRQKAGAAVPVGLNVPPLAGDPSGLNWLKTEKLTPDRTGFIGSERFHG